MKIFESVPSEIVLRRLVVARVVAGIIVLVAVVLAPPVTDSIATFYGGGLDRGELSDGDGEPVHEKGTDVLQTQAAPVEPLTMSY